MTDIHTAGTYSLGDREVRRMGYGAMQLAGPGVFGPPRDREAAIAVLREAVASGVDHIDTSDYYGPFVTNQIIREALHPYDRLTITVSYRHDVTGVHDAGLWQPGVTYFTPLSLHAAVAITASADIAEDRYARTYYSVSPAASSRSTSNKSNERKQSQLNQGRQIAAARGGMSSEPSRATHLE